MSRTISVFVHIDHTAHAVTLEVTGVLVPGDRQELTRMTARARALFPDAAVTVDLSSIRAPDPQDRQDPQGVQGEDLNHRGDGQREISSAPGVALLVTAPSSL